MKIMMKNFEKKRVFFGIETQAPWPEEFPKGKVLEEKDRHLTLAFLGEVEMSAMEKALANFPAPPFTVGPTGKFSQCLFLPKKHPSVVAFEPEWFEYGDLLVAYQKTLVSWLINS